MLLSCIIEDTMPHERGGLKRGKKTQEKEDASGKTHGLREEKIPPERKENRASDIHHT